VDRPEADGREVVPPGTRKPGPRFSPSGRIVAIADETDRSQYVFIDGIARRLRDALA
jgi:hypothetical protein